MARAILAGIACLVLLACEHTAPFHPGDYNPIGPHIPGDPTRLTYNPGQDLQPKWLPDDNILYVGERWDRVDHDRCLSFMPGGGGAISEYVCRTTAADDSINVFEEATVRGDSIVYVRTRTQIFLQPIAPQGYELVAARRGDPNEARVLLSLPFPAPWGISYDGISHVTWLAGTRVAAIGERLTYPVPCRGCARDTVRTGLDILLVDFAVPAAPVLSRFAFGDSASSLAASADGDTLYFTRDGDSRVYRHTFSTDQTDTLYDFAIGIARDVTVGGGKLAAIVGGQVSYVVDSILGGSQPDHGGPMFLLNGATVVQIGDPSWLFRRPALASDGQRVIASARNAQPTADIWLFQLP